MDKRKKLEGLLQQITEAENLALADASSDTAFSSLITRIRQTLRVEVEDARVKHGAEHRSVFFMAHEELTVGITSETRPLEWAARLDLASAYIKNELASLPQTAS